MKGTGLHTLREKLDKLIERKKNENNGLKKIAHAVDRRNESKTAKDGSDNTAGKKFKK